MNETVLPGVGLRHDFTTRGGRAVGVVSHQTGRRDLIVYEEDDPDAAATTVELEGNEGRTLGLLLGGSQIIESLGEFAYQIEGLVIDWLHIHPSSTAAGIELGDSGLSDLPDASIVAIVHEGVAILTPAPTDRLAAGDIAIVVGTPDGVSTLSRILEGPPSPSTG